MTLMEQDLFSTFLLKLKD